MKKSILCMMALTFGFYASGQEKKDISQEVVAQSEPLNQLGNNEIRINIATSIAGLPELNYERFIADNVGLGIAVAFSLEKPEDMEIRSEFIPYGRLYFGKKKASGFFIEGNMAVVGQRESYDDYFYTNDGNYTTQRIDNSQTSFGFGAAIGIKLLTRNGFVGEVYAGGGRLFGDTITGGYPRVGVAIGKRF